MSADHNDWGLRRTGVDVEQPRHYGGQLLVPTAQVVDQEVHRTRCEEALVRGVEVLLPSKVPAAELVLHSRAVGVPPLRHLHTEGGQDWWTSL